MYVYTVSRSCDSEFVFPLFKARVLGVYVERGNNDDGEA